MIQHKVMNCKEWEPAKFKTPSLVSFKFDGVRAFYYPGETRLRSRDNKLLYGFNHIIEPLAKVNYSNIIDMELMIPDYDDWNKMAGEIRNHNQCPDAFGVILDIPSIQMPFHERAKYFSDAMHITPHLNITAQHIVHTISDVEGLYNIALKKGMEGIVIKTPGHRYRNTRSYDWMRMVPIHSVDCKCVGVYEGKGKMAGRAGGIIVEFNGMECKVGTMKGLTHEDRKDLLWFQEDYIGLTAEIHYKELQPSGKPRQPRFKGWRYDK